MSDPFTIRVFVPDGDPDGIRLIDRMNWTGIGVVFPRSKWPEIKHREEFSRTGIYILHGYTADEDDLPIVYVGQADGVRSRVDSHLQKKDFWDWGIVFVSNSGGLNRAHVTWLEYALVNRAQNTKRCRLDNGNIPQEPALSEAERADTQGFLKEILQILPLVNLRVFDYAKPVSTPGSEPKDVPETEDPKGINTIVVPAQQEGFEETFLGENCWYAIRISGGKLTKIKYIAAYQTQPISAITHYAPVDRIEPYGDTGKYKVIFSHNAIPIEHIHYDDASKGAMQSPRYTSITKLKSAKKLTDIF